MKFYDRGKELAELERIRSVAFSVSSQMTVVTGRRRIGKTKLIMKSCEASPTLYLFVSRNNEATLCNQFSEEARRSLGFFVPEGITSFRDLFRLCMEYGKNMPFNLILDEFQEFYNINPAIFSEVQNIWDQTKDNTHVNFLVCGSVYTLMHRIFQDSKEPLYGRASGFIKLKPFMPSVLKQILKDHNPNYSNDDLLALYATTGGVPKYVELLMDNGCVKVQSILERMCGENSLFLEEGNTVLIQEMGKQYGTYYSVLSAIASGATESSRISQLTGVASLGGIMQRLEEDYDLVGKKRPVLSKPGSQTVRYEIKDHFLRFWFRYIVKYQNLIQTGQWESLKDIVVQDYPTYSGKELEAYFKDKLCEELPIGQIGSWWENNRSKTSDNDQHEVDIVAIYHDRPKVLIAEVKRDKRNFKRQPFMAKVELLRAKYFDKYEVEPRCFSLTDM